MYPKKPKHHLDPLLPTPRSDPTSSPSRTPPRLPSEPGAVAPTPAQGATPQDHPGGLNLTMMGPSQSSSGPPSGCGTPVSEVGVATNVIIRDDVNLSARTPVKQEEEEELKHAYTAAHAHTQAAAHAIHVVPKAEVRQVRGTRM
nr:uncharacterized protein LOC113826291 [Penaeus vannamei]